MATPPNVQHICVQCNERLGYYPPDARLVHKPCGTRTKPVTFRPEPGTEDPGALGRRIRDAYNPHYRAQAAK